jgi:hypothetical protein
MRMPQWFRAAVHENRTIRTGHQEKRGRPTRYDSAKLLEIFVEIEARADHIGRGVEPMLRLQRWRYENTREAWARTEKMRVRRLYQLGKAEACWFYRNMVVGRPQQEWYRIEERIQVRMTQLAAMSRRDVFSLTIS